MNKIKTVNGIYNDEWKKNTNQLGRNDGGRVFKGPYWTDALHLAVQAPGRLGGGGAGYRLVAVPTGATAAAAAPAAAAASPRVLVPLQGVVAWVGPVGGVVLVPVGSAVLRVPVGPAGDGGRVPVGPVDAPP